MSRHAASVRRQNGMMKLVVDIVTSLFGGLAMPCTQSVDLSVFYIEHGVGTPIVFVHGNWATSSWWEPVLERLPDGLHGFAYDMRGRGRTVGPDSDYSIPSLAADLKEFGETLGLGPFHVVGHSLGSAVAMQFALENFEVARTLTAVSPAWVDGLRIRESDEANQRELKRNRDLFNQQMNILCPRVYHGEYWNRLLDEGHQQRLEASLGVLGAFQDWRPGDRLQTIRCPKLVIGGERDPLCDLNVVTRAAKALSADFVMMHGVGHGPIIEAADVCVKYMCTNIQS